MRMRKIRITTRSVSGILPSKKNENNIWFESKLERDFAILLENLDSVTFYQEQPVIIEYFHKSKIRTYTPDFLVNFSEEEDDEVKPWLCEIKYRSELRSNFSELKPKFKAAIDFCKENGYEFKIFTEENIRTDYLKNVIFLSGYRSKYVDGSAYDFVIKELQSQVNTTVEKLIASTQKLPFTFRARVVYAIWYGIRIGDIKADIINELLSNSTEIYLENHPTVKY